MDDNTKIMDGRYSCTPSSVAFNNLGNCGPTDRFGFSYNNINSQQNMTGFSFPFATTFKGMKRKWSAIDESVGTDVGSSLCLGLGSSSSSSDSKGSSMTACTTISSLKELEESCMDIELDFSLHLGNEKLPILEVSGVSQLKPLKTQPEVDLELSLSFGATESTITCVSPKFKRYAMNMQFPVSQNSHAYGGPESPPVNDGLSLSALRNFGCVSNNNNFHHVQKRTSPTVYVPSLTSSITPMPNSPVPCISGITQPQHLHPGSSKTCQVEGCGKGARGASGRCIAHGGGRRCQKSDKYRPESCCIIGNYYSLKGQHEKSVMYFRRALKLNKNYLSAWTLMGHEYVEMKNTPAAVDAYRRAVDINPCDYRAWYGLGQAYEMMGMPYYALHYFRKSVYLQPEDYRLWIAMAQCYETEQLHMVEEAIKCYTRAAACNDREAIALHQLAKLHVELGRLDEAAEYYKRDMERMEAEEREGPNMVEALLFLATHCKAQKKFEEAEMYCTRLLDYTGPEKETAKDLLRNMRIGQSAEHLPS